MSILSDFGLDPSKFYLGSICKRGHNWNGVGHSIRIHSTGNCCQCMGVKRLGFASKTPEERFWEKVVRGNAKECWEWKGRKNNAGYGMASIGSQKEMLAHRFSYYIHSGEWPESKYVCHRCDNPGCVNPAHLFLGTCADNVADKVAKNRQGKGSQITSSKLKEQDVVEIIQLLRDGWKHKDIGDRFGVNQATISDIKNKKTWNHVWASVRLPGDGSGRET